MKVYNDLHTLAPQHAQDFAAQAYGGMFGTLEQAGTYWPYVPSPYVPSPPNVHYCYCSQLRADLADFEIVIEQLGTMIEPRLNYGAKLRLLMADPIKGHDLREALARLKVALKEAVTCA